MINDNQLVALVVLLGYDVNNTGVIRFTGVVSTDLKSYKHEPATHDAIERRLTHLAEKDHILPVEGSYWNSINDYVTGQEPSFSGEIKEAEIIQLELREKPLVRIYDDGVFLPNQD